MAETYVVGSALISSPAEDATVSSHFTVTGSARFWRVTEIEIDGGITHQEEDLTHLIEGVRVYVGSTNESHYATGTGSGTRRFETWSFEVHPAYLERAGRQGISAEVHAGEYIGGTHSARMVTIQGTPPTFSIAPPTDVTHHSPPYTATITGTAADDEGVAAVEWRLGDSSAFQAATGTTSWTASVPLPGLGTHTVSLRARDILGVVSPEQQVSVNVIDATAPALSITTPPEGETFTLTATADSVTVEVRGTASDTQTGVARVEWALDDQAQFTPAIPKANNDWSTWNAPIPITVAGNHTITIRAMDKATPTGNPTVLERAVIVEQQFVSKDPEAAFSAAAYLDDLLDFAARRAKAAPAGVLISRQLLVDTFLQPFTDLVERNNRLVANQPVHQVRLCIEVLRRYLG